MFYQYCQLAICVAVCHLKLLFYLILSFFVPCLFFYQKGLNQIHHYYLLYLSFHTCSDWDLCKKSKWQLVFSALQDFSQYFRWSLQYWSLDIQFPLSLYQIFLAQLVTAVEYTNCIRPTLTSVSVTLNYICGKTSVLELWGMWNNPHRHYSQVHSNLEQ